MLVYQLQSMVLSVLSHVDPRVTGTSETVFEVLLLLGLWLIELRWNLAAGLFLSRKGEDIAMTSLTPSGSTHQLTFKTEHLVT